MLKAWLFVLLVNTSLVASHIPDLYLHPKESLNGEWKAIVDPYEIGYYDYRYEQRDAKKNPNRAEAFFVDAKPKNEGDRIEYDFDNSETLKVPGDWNTQWPELYYYEGTLWYRRLVEVAELVDGERTFLRFGASNYKTVVYLNGKRVGDHEGGFTPFSIEVTDGLKAGQNSVVVKVDNKRSKSGVPTLNTDWWNYGGLTREVSLVRTPSVFVADHRVWLDSVPESGKAATIKAWVKVDGAATGESVSLSIEELGQNVNAKTDAEGVAHFEIAAKGFDLWSPENPALYAVDIVSGSSSISDTIGFRTVETRGKEILLNGESVFLRGICMHEEYAVDGGGRVKSEEEAKQFLLWAKELGCNFVRLAHYPHSEATTRLADELGLMIWSEVPVYWTIDWTNESTYQNAENQIVSNIGRDGNRASIIIWSIANETPVKPTRTKFLKRLAAKVRSLDETRLVSAAMEQHTDKNDRLLKIVQDPLADVVDIISFNQYIGWYDGPPEKCDEVTWQIEYDKPVFISEFGAGAKAGLHGPKTQRWTEEFQVEVYEKTLPMLDRIDGYVGCAPWLLVDFRSPRRPLAKVQDGYNRKGLMSEKGEKKQAFFVLQDYYRRKAAEDKAGESE